MGRYFAGVGLKIKLLYFDLTLILIEYSKNFNGRMSNVREGMKVWKYDFLKLRFLFRQEIKSTKIVIMVYWFTGIVFFDFLFRPPHVS